MKSLDLLNAPPEEAFDRLTRLATRALHVPIALVTAVGEDRQRFVSHCGLQEPLATRREMPLAYSFCQHVTRSGAALVIEDARVHPLVRESPAVSELGVIAYAGVPVHAADGRVLAVFCAVDHEIRRWSEEDLQVLKDLAAVASAELQWRGAREAEMRYETLARTAPDAIITIDAQSTVRSANPALKQIIGYAPEEVVGESLDLIIPPRHLAAHAEGLRRYIATGERQIPGTAEFAGLRKDGGEIPLEISFGEYAHEGELIFTSFIRDVSERRRAEDERAFIGEASRVLASSLDYETTLKAVARLAVLRIADWCAVDLVEPTGIQRVAIAHTDPEKEDTAQQLRRRYPADPDEAGGTAQVIRTGQPILYADIPESLLTERALDEEHQRILQALGMRSAIIVPLITHGRVLGSIAFVQAQSGRRYAERDLRLAEELARQAAIAVDHARLFLESEDARVAVGQQAAELERQMEVLQEQSAELESDQFALQVSNDRLRSALDELAKVESHYRRLVETSPHGVFLLNTHGHFTELNLAGERILERSADQVLGRHFASVVEPDDLPWAADAFTQVISGERDTVELEVRIVRPSGERRLVLVPITAVRENGVITGVHGVCRDITDERRVQRELEESELKYRLLVESIRDYAIIMLDPEGRIVSWNVGAEAITGHPREEIVGQHFRMLYPQEDDSSDPVRHELEVAVRDGRFEAEGWRVKQDGTRFWAYTVITAVRDPHGTLQGFAKITRDLTERREAQLVRQESERLQYLLDAVETERTWLSSLFEQAPAFVALLEGPDHVFKLCNRLYHELIGHRDVLDRPMRDAIPELAGQGYLELLDQVYLTGEPALGVASRVVLQREPGAPGEERFVNFLYQPLLNQDGSVAGIFVHGVDVSDLVGARQEAERASRAKNEFLGRMSHELRTPLNAILGFGQLLAPELAEPEDVESIQQILKAGQHLLSLIDEVLDIARIEAGQISLAVEPVSLHSVLRESVDLVRLTAAQRQIRWQTPAFDGPDHMVLADAQRLKQVLLNLLSNAIKFNRQGGTITLACDQFGDAGLRIVVEDTGRGIPGHKLARLFTPFDRLDTETIDTEGTGLGLALSRGLIEAMGGSIGVESEEDRRSRFWVELPLADSATPRAQPAAPQPRAQSQPQSAKRTILIIEDNLANVRLLERVFRKRPHFRLLTAMQGSLGLELARQHRPDLVLLDLNLPDFSGDHVLRQIHEDPGLRDTPVVMISGDAVPAQAERLIELGAHAFITKPFEIHELLRLVDELLGPSDS